MDAIPEKKSNHKHIKTQFLSHSNFSNEFSNL